MELLKIIGIVLACMTVPTALIWLKHYQMSKYKYKVGDRIYPYARIKEITSEGMWIVIENGMSEVFLSNPNGIRS